MKTNYSYQKQYRQHKHLQNKITRKQKWGEKQQYGYFKRQTSEITHNKTWIWLRKGDLKRETESLLIVAQNNSWPVSWGSRIHWLHLCIGVRPPPNECPGYDTKQSDGEVPAVLELWGMRSTPSLPLLPGPLWPGVVAPDRALSMG